jgi:hypothetical protein
MVPIETSEGHTSGVELPDRIANLYRHWERHASFAPTGASPSGLDQDLFARVASFAAERQRAWERKQRGEAMLSADQILSRFRFCNVYRELDRQTIEIHEWLAPLRDDLEAWLLNLAVARMVARPETSRAVGFLVPGRDNAGAREALRALPRPRYGVPYVFPVSAIMRTDAPTREEFFTRFLPRRAREMADAVRGLNASAVADAVAPLAQAIGVGLRFHATEILIDVAYQFPERVDLFGRFPVGPGSARTIGRLLPGADSAAAAATLASIGAPADFPFPSLGGRPIHLSAENWEGVGCEWRKYENLSAGRGRRRVYRQKNVIS